MEHKKFPPFSLVLGYSASSPKGALAILLKFHHPLHPFHQTSWPSQGFNSHFQHLFSISFQQHQQQQHQSQQQQHYRLFYLSLTSRKKMMRMESKLYSLASLLSLPLSFCPLSLSLVCVCFLFFFSSMGLVRRIEGRRRRWMLLKHSLIWMSS